MKISLYPPLSIHEIGQRPNQEDSIIQWNNRLFVLCDGMGGHEKGEVASQTVCKSLVTWFNQNINTDDGFTDDQLREAIEYAYQQLDKYADGSFKQMGTTLTLLYVHAQGVTAAHIGDSRIYHIRPNSSPLERLGEVLYQSRDHSLAFDLFQSGEISYDEMQNFTQKNVITRAMTPGEDNRMRPDIIHISDIQPGDYFYMCSDGMLEKMSNDNLTTLLSSEMEDEGKLQQLNADTSNNQDNHSAWLIHIKDIVKEKGDEQLINEEPTSRCNAINILPQENDNNDVQIVDDDVVVVSAPQKPKKKQILFLKWGIAAILCLFIMIAACFVLLGSDEKNNNEVGDIEHMLNKPIKPSLKKKVTIDTTHSNSQIINRDDSARNK